MIDIYFEPDYGKLYERGENGVSQVFHFSGEHGSIQHAFMKRKIPFDVRGGTYYDLVTPYGYGGPIILECEPAFKARLLQEYAAAFGKYCNENNIVSEFVRFHPIAKNHDDFKDIYHVSYIRDTVATRITAGEDPVRQEFSKSARKNISRALRSGVQYQVIEEPSEDHISQFLEIYYATMDRNRASDYYYFEKNYFSQCLHYFGRNVLVIRVVYNETVIAMGFYFVYGDLVHTHLSGALKEYLNLSPAYVIRYAAAQWAKENNISLIHHGGGRSNSKDDALYKFKRRFTKATEFEFYVGKKVWDPEVYEELCDKSGVDENVSFFPAYRYQED